MKDYVVDDFILCFVDGLMLYWCVVGLVFGCVEVDDVEISW